MSRPSPQTDRVVALVDFLASHPSQSFTLAELARRLGLHRQTCHSMLQTLLDSGWLVRHPRLKTYRLGPALGVVGRAVAISSPVLEHAQLPLQDLADELDHTVILLQRTNWTLTLVDATRPGGRALHPLAIGQRYPLRAPIGGSIIAWDEGSVDEWVGDVPAEARERFLSSLAGVRNRGYEVRLDRTTPLLTDVLERLGIAGPEQSDDLVRQFAELVVGLSDELDVIEADRRYPVSGVSTAVFDTMDEAPTFSLGLTFPTGEPQIDGAQIHRFGSRLVEFAAALSASVGVTADRWPSDDSTTPAPGRATTDDELRVAE